MKYFNNVENGFAAKIDREGNFNIIIQNSPYFKAGHTYDGNVHNLSYTDEIILDGMIHDCFDMRTGKGKAVYMALLNANETNN